MANAARTDKSRARRLVAAALVGLIAAVILAGAALGRDAEDITITEGQTINKDYPALPSQEPPAVALFFGNFGQRSPNFCRDNGQWCDVIDLNIQLPAHYTSADFFKVDITLSWPNPSGVNDLNMYLHRANSSGTQVLSSAGANNPEKITLQDPPDPKYWIVVNNARGVNSGYRLSVSFVGQGRIDAPEEPDEFNFGSPSRFESDDSLSADSEIFGLPTAPQPAGANASSGPRPIDRPGPDGSLSRKTLVVLAASSAPGGNSRLPFIVSTAVAALGATGLAVFLYLRGRHDADL